MKRYKGGGIGLSVYEADLLGRALRAFMRDDSEIAFKDGDVSHSEESEALWALHDALKPAAQKGEP